jgi:acyl-CoA thioesterase
MQWLPNIMISSVIRSTGGSDMSQHHDEIECHKKNCDRIIEVFKNEPYANFLGIELTELGPGTATAEVKIQEHMLNTHGTVHGAIIFALADYVFAAACNSYGKTSVGLSTTVNFMAPAFPGKLLKATAREEKRNHRTSWYNIRVESEGELVATMEALAYRKSQYFVPVEETQEL